MGTSSRIELVHLDGCKYQPSTAVAHLGSNKVLLPDVPLLRIFFGEYCAAFINFLELLSVCPKRCKIALEFVDQCDSLH